MSFVDRDDIMALIEPLFVEIIAKLGIKTDSYSGRSPCSVTEAMVEVPAPTSPICGSGSTLVDLTDLVARRPDSVSSAPLWPAAGQVKAISAPGRPVSRKQLVELTEQARRYGARGLGYDRYGDRRSADRSAAKFLSEGDLAAIFGALRARRLGDLVVDRRRCHGAVVSRALAS